jgi:hypothetical protein
MFEHYFRHFTNVIIICSLGSKCSTKLTCSPGYKVRVKRCLEEFFEYSLIATVGLERSEHQGSKYTDGKTILELC